MTIRTQQAQVAGVCFPVAEAARPDVMAGGAVEDQPGRQAVAGEASEGGMSRIEQIGDCTLYLGDCREILPTLGKVDAVVTDPPYGLGDKMQGGTWGAKEGYKEMLAWDAEAPTQQVLKAIIAKAGEVVLWGGQYFALPASRCWLIWNKINAVPTMADFEVAWTSLDRPSKRFDAPVGRVEFGHPTQKPLPLMSWCLGFVAGETILDPFMGSGTTGVACVKLGRKFIGIEIHEPYFDIACKRIQAAVNEPRLPMLDQPHFKQEAML